MLLRCAENAWICIERTLDVPHKAQTARSAGALIKRP
jgi:hypothetical protein